MRSIGLEELRKRLGVIVDAAERGESIAILRNGRMVARLVPPIGDIAARTVQFVPPTVQSSRSSAECGTCGAALDPDGSCFVCGS